MHGIVLRELRQFTTARFGEETWDWVLTQAGVKTRLFLPIATYPDEDVLAIVLKLARATDTGVSNVLEEFGEYLAPRLVGAYGSLLQREWRTLDVLEHVDQTVHKVIRAREPGAEPPAVETSRRGPDEVRVTYRSKRQLCSLARGLIRGLSRHFGETVRIAEETCMLRGERECRWTVRKLHGQPSVS